MVRHQVFSLDSRSGNNGYIRTTQNATLHWDGKLIATDHKDEDQLAILVSGMPTCEEGNLIGIPVIEGNKGHMQSRATLKEVYRWRLQENNRASYLTPQSPILDGFAVDVFYLSKD